MMSLIFAVATLASAFALIRAGLRLRRTSLFYAFGWAFAAWCAWVFQKAEQQLGGDLPLDWNYLALALTGCAAIACLGARRPITGPWNFVVLALLAVECLPVFRAWIQHRNLHLDFQSVALLGLSVVIGASNYLPTRYWPAATAILIGGGTELLALSDLRSNPNQIGAWLLAYGDVGSWLIILSPFVALLVARPSSNKVDANSSWFCFRDCFGVVWALRLDHHFNHSMKHNGIKATLSWGGLQCADALSPEERERIDETLQALMKRFVAEETNAKH